jgi:hypothetical protein
VPVDFFGVIVACSGSPLTTIVGGPLCAPTSAEQCKNGGWTRFNNPVFKSQGECVTFAQHPKASLNRRRDFAIVRCAEPLRSR